MNKEVEKYTKLLELAKLNELNVIKDSLRGEYLPLVDCIERTKKDSKQLKYLNALITDVLGIDIVVKDITMLGLNNVAYCVVFELKNNIFFKYDFELMVPNTENITIDSLLVLDYGKIQLSYKNTPSTWSVIYSSYNLASFELKFKEWIELENDKK